MAHQRSPPSQPQDRPQHSHGRQVGNPRHGVTPRPVHGPDAPFTDRRRPGPAEAARPLSPRSEAVSRETPGLRMPARVFFRSGGGGAIDTAAKLARRFWFELGQPDRTLLVSRTAGYHGTYGFGTALGGIPPIARASGRRSRRSKCRDRARDRCAERPRGRFGRVTGGVGLRSTSCRPARVVLLKSSGYPQHRMDR